MAPWKTAVTPVVLHQAINMWKSSSYHYPFPSHSPIQPSPWDPPAILSCRNSWRFPAGTGWSRSWPQPTWWVTGDRCLPHPLVTCCHQGHAAHGWYGTDAPARIWVIVERTEIGYHHWCKDFNGTVDMQVNWGFGEQDIYWKSNVKTISTHYGLVML